MLTKQERIEKARKMYREGVHTAEIRMVIRQVYDHITELDRIERKKKGRANKKNKSLELNIINKIELEKTLKRNEEIIRNFNSIFKGSIITIKKKKKKEDAYKKGKVIYKDSKLVVVQYKNYKESFSYHNFIGDFKLIKIERA